MKPGIRTNGDHGWRADAMAYVNQRCAEAYERAQQRRRGRKRHRPYEVPTDARFVVQLLSMWNQEIARDAWWIFSTDGLDAATSYIGSNEHE